LDIYKIKQSNLWCSVKYVYRKDIALTMFKSCSWNLSQKIILMAKLNKKLPL